MGASNSFWQSPGGSAVISAIGSAGSGLFGGLFSAGSQRRQYEYNLRLQQQQQDWQRMMWELQNEYNLPANEIQRLLDAGVNPALAFNNAGGVAAPVPQSGSSGGVSAPTASIPNVGASAVQASQAQQRLDNETKVADSTAEKNKAEAAAATANAGLTDVKKNYLDFEFGVDKELRDIIVGNRRLEYQFNQLKYASGYLDYTRNDMYTTAFPTLLGQRQEINRRQIRILGHTSNKILAEVALLQAQKGLTDEQAKIARQRVVCATFDAMMARFNVDFYRTAYNTVYASKTGEYNPVRDQIVQTIRNNVAEQLVRSETGLLEAGFDSSFQSRYGQNLRYYNYETVRRGANHIRSQIYNGIVGSLVGIGSMAISGANVGASFKLRNQMMQSWGKTGRDFGASVVPYGSMRDATTPSYNGGTEYYPYYDF